ncbi:MAG TPA: hypothetical protein VFX68_00025 [Sulfuricurvum sp.]|nr:hypothetical protein [Sulfuricurvum sp.]
MQKILLLCVLMATLSADFHNELYSKVCYTIAHNRVDLQPAGAKASQIRAEIVNRAYVTAKVVVWEREDRYDFPALILIEDEVIKSACEDTLNTEKTANSNEFVFYAGYQKAVYKHTVDALMKVAKPKK